MKRMMIISIVCAFTAAPALADLTTVYQTSYGPSSAFGSELDLAPESELNGVNPDNPGGDDAGNAYTPANILDTRYTSYTRIHDDVDQVWEDLNGGVDVKAIYTSSTLDLVFSKDEAFGAGDATILANVSDLGGGSNVDVVGDEGDFDIVDNTDLFIWGVKKGSTVLWSNEALNTAGDRMVTYRIDDDPTVVKYVIAFEDGTDDDFQDFVVEVSNVRPVPVPGAVLLGVLGLAAAGRKLRKVV